MRGVSGFLAVLGVSALALAGPVRAWDIPAIDLLRDLSRHTEKNRAERDRAGETEQGVLCISRARDYDQEELANPSADLQAEADRLRKEGIAQAALVKDHANPSPDDLSHFNAGRSYLNKAALLDAEVSRRRVRRLELQNRCAEVFSRMDAKQVRDTESIAGGAASSVSGSAR